MCNDSTMTRLDVETQGRADQPVLVLQGELDMGTEAQLRAASAEQLSVNGVSTLRLDLAGLTFLDSTGVSALVDLRKQARDQGVTVELVAVSRRAARVLTIVGLAESFGITADPDAVPGQTESE